MWRIKLRLFPTAESRLARPLWPLRALIGLGRWLVGLPWELIIVSILVGSVYVLAAVTGSAQGSGSRPSGGGFGLFTQPLDALTEASSTRSAVTLEVRWLSDFIWPADGDITSYFGLYHPTGIDIGLSDGEAPVWASRAGVIEFAGGDACCEYGRFVIVDHGDGWRTLYGHLARVSVTAGQVVAQGELLGLGGATGQAKGKHLHFEMLRDGHYVDPLRYLAVRRLEPAGDAGLFTCPGSAIALRPASTASIRFPEESFASYRLEAAGVAALPVKGGSAPAVEAGVTDVLSVLLSVAPAAAAQGRSFEYELSLRLTGPEGPATLVCRLSLATNKTGINTPDVSDNHPAIEPIAPTPTIVLGIHEPTATPTRTPRPTSTPAPPPTATPRLQWTATPKPTTPTATPESTATP
jgi:hypothetical protein